MSTNPPKSRWKSSATTALWKECTRKPHLPVVGSRKKSLSESQGGSPTQKKKNIQGRANRDFAEKKEQFTWLSQLKELLGKRQGKSNGLQVPKKRGCQLQNEKDIEVFLREWRKWFLGQTSSMAWNLLLERKSSGLLFLLCQYLLGVRNWDRKPRLSRCIESSLCSVEGAEGSGPSTLNATTWRQPNTQSWPMGWRWGGGRNAKPFSATSAFDLTIYYRCQEFVISSYFISSKLKNTQMLVIIVALLASSVFAQNCTAANCLVCPGDVCSSCQDSYYLDSQSQCASCSDANCKVCPQNGCSECATDYFL